MYSYREREQLNKKPIKAQIEIEDITDYHLKSQTFKETENGRELTTILYK